MFFSAAAQSLTNTLSRIEITPHTAKLPSILIHVGDSDGTATIKYVNVI